MVLSPGQMLLTIGLFIFYFICIGQILLCQTNFVYWLVLDVKEPYGYQGVTMQMVLGYVY